MGQSTMRRRIGSAAAAGLSGLLSVLLAAAPAAVQAADYPDRPVKVITQGAPGSGPDLVARIVADHLARRWGTSVSIVSRSGAAGLIAAQEAALAEPDGYTLYLPTVTTFAILPEMHEKMPVDLERRFVPIGLVADLPVVIGVASTLGVGSLSELAGFARARPGQIFYAANNKGSLPHVIGEMVRQAAGIDMSFVPYAGALAGLHDVLGGRVAVIVESYGALAGVIKSGALKPVAVASARRLPKLPDVPVVAETVPGFDAVPWLALMAPAGTPQAVLAKVSADLQGALADPAVRARLEDIGAVARPAPPVETAAFIRAEVARWRPVVRQLGLREKP